MARFTPFNSARILSGGIQNRPQRICPNNIVRAVTRFCGGTWHGARVGAPQAKPTNKNGFEDLLKFAKKSSSSSETAFFRSGIAPPNRLFCWDKDWKQFVISWKTPFLEHVAMGFSWI